MRLSISSLVAVVVALALLPASARAHAPQDLPPEAVRDTPGSAPVWTAPVFTFRDARMAYLVRELERSSPTAARMLQTLREFGVPVVFGTVASVLDEVRAQHRDYDPTEQKALGFMAPLLHHHHGSNGPMASTIVVGVDLDRVGELFGKARGIPRPPDVSWTEIQRLETMALLAHELVHAYGLALSGGDPRRGCFDPHQGEPPSLSCVVVGENVIRREIGAPLDWGYGMSRLADLPDRYAEHNRHRSALRSIGEVASALLERGTSPGLSLP